MSQVAAKSQLLLNSNISGGNGRDLDMPFVVLEMFPRSRSGQKAHIEDHVKGTTHWGSLYYRGIYLASVCS